MIDEYQDTNRSQYELMRLLTETATTCAWSATKTSRSTAGAARTSATSSISSGTIPNANVIRLEQNYRSTKNILEAASAVVANNKERKGKWLWTESGEGEDRLYEAPDARKRGAVHRRHHRKDPARRIRNERVAVLYRTNSQSRQIEEALRRYGRKYIVVGGFSFYQRAEVKDMLAYLKVLLSPQDSISLLRIINTPARGIGKTHHRPDRAVCARKRHEPVERASSKCWRKEHFRPAPNRPLKSFLQHD